MDIPYRAEYAKSNRSKCRACKKNIEQGKLRLATLTQSRFSDGKQANWFHLDCFSIKHRITTADEIEHFESLRTEDQDLISTHILPSVVVPDPNIKGNKGKNKIAAKKAALEDYAINLAKNWSICRGCRQKITKNEIRVSKKDFTFEYEWKGRVHQWYHLMCFVQLRADLGFFKSAEKLPGFNDLSAEHQVEALKALPPVMQGEDNVPSVEQEFGNLCRKTTRALPVLYDMNFIIVGKPKRGKEILKKEIQALGGKITSLMSWNVMAVVAAKPSVEKMVGKVRAAERRKIHVISEDFVDEAKQYAGKIPDLIIKKAICNWGSDPAARLPGSYRRLNRRS